MSLFERSLEEKLTSESVQLSEIPIQYVGVVNHGGGKTNYERIIAGEVMSDTSRKSFISDDDMAGIVPRDETAVTGTMGFADFIICRSGPGLINLMTISYLGVEPEYRRKGVGRALAIELERIAQEREVEKVEACVVAPNKDNIFPLLQEFGFRIGSTRALSYLMVKDIR